MLSFYQSSITSPFWDFIWTRYMPSFPAAKNMSCALMGNTVTSAHVDTLALQNSESAMSITYWGMKLPLSFEACPSYADGAWERCGHGCHQPDSNHSSLDHEHAPGLLRHGIFFIFFTRNPFYLVMANPEKIYTIRMPLMSWFQKCISFLRNGNSVIFENPSILRRKTALFASKWHGLACAM